MKQDKCIGIILFTNWISWIINRSIHNQSGPSPFFCSNEFGRNSFSIDSNLFGAYNKPSPGWKCKQQTTIFSYDYDWNTQELIFELVLNSHPSVKIIALI